MTVFGTDEFTKGADGSYKFFNDYTAQLNGDVDFIRDTWFDFYKGINTANTVIAAAPTANLPDATKSRPRRRSEVPPRALLLHARPHLRRHPDVHRADHRS